MLCWRINEFAFIIWALKCITVEGTPVLIEDPEDITNLTTPPPATYTDWVDWESWKPSMEITQDLVRYKSGCDLDGLVVHVLEFGNFDLRKWAAKPKDKIEEFWRAYEQWLRFQEKDASLNSNQGMVILMDFDGFTLAHFASQQAMKFGLKMMSLLFRHHRIIKYGFILNVNYAAESWIHLTRPFLGDLLASLEIFGTQSEIWKPKLLAHIGASQLPPKYGGSKDWKPLEIF